MTPIPEWEVRFDEEFDKETYDPYQGMTFEQLDRFKSFIRQLREEDMKKLVEKVDSMELTALHSEDYKQGWHAAKSKLEDIIKSHYES